MKKKRPPKREKPVSSNPYPRGKRIRIPRQIESAASLWLDFFQQFVEIVIDTDNHQTDANAIARARTLADTALETFQERFPGVHP